jgi:hypothetical protein
MSKKQKQAPLGYAPPSKKAKKAAPPPQLAGPKKSYPALPAGLIPLSPLGDALIGANLLSIDRGDYPINSVEAARQASIPPAVPPPPGASSGPANIGIGSSAYKKLVRGDRRFKELEYQYSKAPSLLQQQANLTGNSLINIPSTGMKLAPVAGPLAGQPVNYGNLEGITLNTYPTPIPNTNPPLAMDFYDFDSKSPTFQQMVISPARAGKVNPLAAFIHEGRHAIDDLYKRPHQHEMVNFLAEEEGKAPSVPKPLKKTKNYVPFQKDFSASRQGWLQPLLEGAQAIIPPASFAQDYPYPGKQGFFEQDVNNSLQNFRATKKSRPAFDFQDAKETLDRFRTKVPLPGGKAKVVADPGDAFKSFSEFPAFMMEGLGQPWATFGAAGLHDPSRRFIKENLRTMYRDYDELSGGSLATQYPEVHKAFFDRYNQLRNPDFGPSSSSDPGRQARSLEKMGAPPVPAGSPVGTMPVLDPLAAPVLKKALNAFSPGVGGGPDTPNPFPAPKYTNRAKGGRVTGKNLLSRFKKT